MFLNFLFGGGGKLISKKVSRRHLPSMQRVNMMILDKFTAFKKTISSNLSLDNGGVRSSVAKW